MKARAKCAVLAGTAVGALCADPAWAQTAAPNPPQAAESGHVEDIVVTARRVSENLQDTPISITALSNRTLEERRVVSLETIATLAPSVAITQTYAFVGAINPFIRGIGQNEVQYGQDSPVGIYIDGVYNGRTNNSRFDLVELERVEVLRGPQGTLFGRNTTGGAISIVTREPNNDFGAELKSSYGNYDSLSTRLRVDTGELGASGVKATVAYQHRQNSGYVDNSFVSSKQDYGASNSDSVWAKIVGNWGDLSATLSGDYSDLRAYPMLVQSVAASTTLTNFLNASPTLNGEIFSVNPHYLSSTSTDAPYPQQIVKTRGVGLTLAYQLSDIFTVKSITAARGFTFSGGSPAGPNGLTGRFGFTAGTATLQTVPSIYTIDPRHQKQSQFSQEVQLLGKVGAFSFVLGGFYFQERARDASTAVVIVPQTGFAFLVTTPTDYSISNKSYAGFGQVSWKPGFADEKLELTGGLRYTQDKKSVVQRASIARTAKADPDNLSVLASVSYEWRHGLLTYVRYATGYRAGGFNTRATGTTPFIYLPETAKSYEVGFKADLLDRHVRLNGAVFQTNNKDLQVSQFGALTSEQLNAKARIRGFELETTIVPVNNLTLTGSLGHVSPVYKALFLAAPGTGVLTNFASIGQFPYVPHWTAAAGVNYQFPASGYGTWAVRGDYSFNSKVWFFPTDLPNISPLADKVAAPAYGLFSGRVSLSDIALGGTKAQINVFADNILDKHYVVGGVDFGPAVGYGTQAFGRPRTFGVEVRISL